MKRNNISLVTSTPPVLGEEEEEEGEAEEFVNFAYFNVVFGFNAANNKVFSVFGFFFFFFLVGFFFGV